MTNLPNLPNEILEVIIEHTIPKDSEDLDDFSNFLESCQTIHHRANHTFQERHQTYRHRSLCSIYLGGYTRHTQNIYKPLDLLQKVLFNPILVRHIKCMWLGLANNPHQSHYEATGDKDIETIDERFSSKISREIRRCVCIPDQEKELWVRETKQGNSDAATAMLFTLLHNVSTVNLSKDFVIGEFSETMLRWIAEASETPNPKACFTPFKDLESVGTYSDYKFRGEPELEFLTQSSRLPSVNNLRCEGLEPAGNMRNWDHPKTLSRVTNIQIIKSKIPPDSLNHLLERTQSLKKFSYTLSTTKDSEWFPFNVCQSLKNHVAHSLEELHLDWVSECGNPGRRAHLGILHGFISLKRLRIGTKVIAYQNDDESGDLQPLVKSLPSSIREVELISRASDWNYERAAATQIWGFMVKDGPVSALNLQDTARLFHGLKERRAKCLPNLKSIAFVDEVFDEFHEPNNPYNKMIRMACRAAGIALLGCGKQHRGRKSVSIFALPEDAEVWLGYSACLRGDLSG